MSLLRIRPVYWLLLLYVILATAAALQAWTLTRKMPEQDGPGITKYNNYIIFRNSFDHLTEGKNLYCAYPEEHWDLFKYSPTFALAFGLFRGFPDLPGLALWNLLNALLFFVAIRQLPGMDDKKKALILLLCVADAMTSLQNSQSNLLVAGLILQGFNFFEKGKPVAATLCLVSTFYIKIFGLAALALLLFYPRKWKSVAWAAAWFVLLLMVPLPVTGFGGLAAQYGHYLEMLRNDHAASVGLSVMGWLKTWFGIGVSQVLLALAGFGLLCVPLLGPGRFDTLARRSLFLAGLMIWMVIFNHKAESPTFIIATSAIWLWFFTRKRTVLVYAAVILVFFLTSLAATDLWPRFIRSGFFEPWGIKVVPCIFVWILIICDLFTPAGWTLKTTPK